MHNLTLKGVDLLHVLLHIFVAHRWARLALDTVE
jgi:hypothetical protein